MTAVPQPPRETPPAAFGTERGKCIRCLEAGLHWNQCKARIPPAPEKTPGGGAQSQNDGGQTTVCCLSKSTLDTTVKLSRSREQRSGGVGEKWLADSGASFHMTYSADLLHDARLLRHDNEGAMGLAHIPLISSNSKHIDVRYYYLRELVGKGDLSVNISGRKTSMRTLSRRLLAKTSFEKQQALRWPAPNTQQQYRSS